MKYEGKRPSAVDEDINVYMFGFGIEEVKLLKVIISHYRKNVPRILETTPMLGRLRNFEKVLIEFFKQNENR